MADLEQMFFENDDGEVDLDLSSSDSELELLEIGHLTDTLDRTTSDISSDTLSNSSWINERFLDDPEGIDGFVYPNNVTNEGRRLYLIFLQDEILKNRLHLPDYIIRANKIIDTSLCKNILSLHRMFYRFELSAQRKCIKEQAREIVFQGLNFKIYAEKLRSLFEEVRVSWEKILVIFSFCADISVRALNTHSEKVFEKIQDWTLIFIDGYICAWVQAEGGWEVILHQSYTPATKIAIISFCCVGIIALFVYIRNNSK